MYFRRKFSEAEHRRFDNWTRFLTLRIVCGTGSIKRSGVCVVMYVNGIFMQVHYTVKPLKVDTAHQWCNYGP